MEPREKLLNELLGKKEYESKGVPVDVVREEFKRAGFDR